MKRKIFPLAIAMIILVLSLGFVSAEDIGSDESAGSDGDSSKLSDKPTSNPLLALVVVAVCLVLIRYRE